MNETDSPADRHDRTDAEAAEEGSSLVADEPSPDAERERERGRKPAALLGLFALGVVYGDIGTSPIYAFRESLHGRDPVPASTQNVLGILSLIFWSLRGVGSHSWSPPSSGC